MECHIARVVCRHYELPKPRPQSTGAGRQLHADLSQGMTCTSSHLQCQRDSEDPKEEGHQSKATDEEGSPSQALDDQALGQGERETVITSLLAAGEGDVEATLGSWLKDRFDLQTAQALSPWPQPERQRSS